MIEIALAFVLISFVAGWAFGYVFGYTKGQNELDYRIKEFVLENLVNCPPEFQKVLDDNFEDILA